jgi:nucleoside phosphorylase
MVCSNATMSGLDRTDVLIVAAHVPEMAGLRPWLSDSLIGQIRGLNVRGKAIGMGMAAAGPAAARGILAVKPRAVLLVGSCGVYPNLPRFRPHDVVVATRVQLISHAVSAGRSEFPGPMHTGLDCDPLLAAGVAAVGARVFPAPIACTLAQTVDDTLAGAVHPATGCEAENLEAFAVAQACKAAEVPFTAVLGVSNIVGSTGAQDWRQFQRAAVNAAAEAVVAWIQRGAQGLPHA